MLTPSELYKQLFIVPVTALRIDIVNTNNYIRFMDERYELNGITFVWDASKARMNLTKHQVTFNPHFSPDGRVLT